MQFDGKHHRQFQSLPVVGIFFLTCSKKFFKHRWGDSQEVVEGLIIILAELFHQLVIMSHEYSPHRFQSVFHPTGSWSSPSFMLYHFALLLLCFWQKCMKPSFANIPEGLQNYPWVWAKILKSGTDVECQKSWAKWWTNEKMARFIAYLVWSCCRWGEHSKNCVWMTQTY